MLRQFIFVASVVFYSGCGWNPDPSHKIIQVDFNKKTGRGSIGTETDSTSELRVAIAGVISPKETIVYYEEMLAYLAHRLHRPVRIEQRKTYREINDRIRDRHIDLAFVCSGAFAEALDQKFMRMLAVPVMHGQPYYQAYIISHTASGIRSWESLEGKSFAFTDPLSNTGFGFVIQKLNAIHANPETYFSRTLFTHAHDYSIQMVSRRLVDGASVDGLIYEYLKIVSPDRVANINIIEKSEKYGIPPVVVPASCPEDQYLALQNVFLTMNTDSTGKAILNKLMIDRFEIGREELYRNIYVTR